MPEAYIVSAVRTAGGRRNGRLRGWHAAELAGRVLEAVIGRIDANPTLVEDVIMGCVSQCGEQAANIARNAILASRLPESIPGTTVDRQCGSSQQAIHFAAQAVMSGSMDCVIAAGVEHMSHVPMGTTLRPLNDSSAGPWDAPTSVRRYPGIMFSQFTGAEMMARKYELQREALDEFAVSSHRRAAVAAEAGRFDSEILPLEGLAEDGTIVSHDRDEGIRVDCSTERLASLAPLADEGWHTAATSSQLCDGASAVMVVNDRGLRAIGCAPLARIHQMTVLAEDPVIVLEAPLNATKRALSKAGMTINEIDLYEVNEAFAAVPLAWLKAIHGDPHRLNVNGGAIALGHPLGASGSKLMTTLVHGLRARKKRYGLQTMCEGGGLANVTIIEAL